MTSDFSGIPAACASTDAHTTHLIQYTAFTPDDGEQTGIATVTANVTADGEHRVPYAQLAAIPGFIEADVIREHDGDPRPLLLGPDTDAPGHPAWCVDHQDTIDGGRSLCWGEKTVIGDTVLQLDQPTGKPTTVWYYVDAPSQDEELSPSEARERAAQLREIAAQLDALADQAEAGSVVTA